jgi:hypothetical protein
MKVKELLAALAKADPEAEVILQKDAEGNGYSPLRGADLKAVYVAENTYSGEVYPTTGRASDHCLTQAEWVEMKKRPRCVVLYPIN